METESKEKELEEITNQKPDEPEEKKNSEIEDGKDYSNVLNDIQLSLSKLNEGLSSVKDVTSKIGALSEKMEELESRINTVAPNYLEDDRVKIDGYYDYDAHSKRFKNENAEKEREHAFKVLEELKGVYI